MNKKIIIFFQYLGIFIAVPIIGTLIHELGHFFVAINLGCSPIFHYSSVTFNCGRSLNTEESLILTLGGPIITWIQCVVPFIMMIIIFRGEKRIQMEEKIPISFIILLSFLTVCGRFIFNAVGYLLFNSQRLDEWKIEDYLNIPHGIIIYGFALISLIILLISIFFIPKNKRITIFFGAIIGAILGYVIWYYGIGFLIFP